jgi:hypothetical protein
VNQERAARGLQPLSRVSPLDRAAQDYAVRMGREGFFSHTAPDGSSPRDRIQAAGYPGGTWGENIAAGQTTAEAVMQSWMNSSGHAANILNANFTHLGIGVATGGGYGIYWVQNFGATSSSVPGPWVPRLDRLTPATGGAGSLLTLEGANLGSPGTVTVGGARVVIEQWSTSQAVVRLPSSSTTGTVVVTNAYGSSNSLSLGSTPGPSGLRLDAVFPSQARSGDTFRLTGAGFGAQPGRVRAYGALVTLLSWSDTEVTVRVTSSRIGKKALWIELPGGSSSNRRYFKLTR